MIYFLAYLGGLILNLMPCVLPVLFIKALSMQRRSWHYVAGVMSVFFCFGVAACAPGFIWGGQFDRWWFTWGVAVVCFLMGLVYLDVWNLPNFGFREVESDFGKGVLTTILSSACSGPFLGAVFAASLTEPPLKIIALFCLIGAGLMTPYLLFPRSWIPKPGAWMLIMKRLAGISMIGTAIWLLAGLAWALVSLIVLLWWHGRRRLALSVVYAGCLLGLAGFTLWGQAHPVEPFNESRLIHLLNENRVVAIQFTSKYCITCQWNEATLNSRSVRQQLSRYDVVVMKATMPEGLGILKQLGFTSVPVLAVFPGKDQPLVLPDVITKSQVINALEQAYETTHTI